MAFLLNRDEEWFWMATPRKLIALIGQYKEIEQARITASHPEIAEEEQFVQASGFYF